MIRRGMEALFWFLLLLLVSGCSARVLYVRAKVTAVQPVTGAAEVEILKVE